MKRKNRTSKQLIFLIIALFLFSDVASSAPDLCLRQQAALQRGVLDKEAIRIGKPSEIIEGLEGAVVKDVTIQVAGRFAEGKVIVFDTDGIEVIQEYNPEALAWDVVGERIANKQASGFAPGSKPLARWAKEKRDRLERTGRCKLLFASNSLQTNFKGPNGFLIKEGKLIRKEGEEGKKEGARGVLQSEYEPLDGEYTVFVIDKDKRGVEKVRIQNNTLVTIEYKEAISGPALVKNGKNVSNQIKQRNTSQDVVKEGGFVESGIPSKDDEVNWDPETTKAAFSAIGVDKKGQIVLVNVAGRIEKEGVLVNDLAEALIKLGVVDAILLGGSADVQQWIKGEYSVVAGSRAGSTTKVVDVRPLNAAVLGCVDFSKFYWTKKKEIRCDNSQVFIPCWAKAGYGDVTYVLKFVDALNTRGIIPSVLLVGSDSEIKDALKKFKEAVKHFPRAKYTLLREEQAGKKLVVINVEGDKIGTVEPQSKRPVVIEFLNNAVNPRACKRENIAGHLAIINRYNASRQKPYVIGMHEYSDTLDARLENLGELADYVDIYTVKPGIDFNTPPPNIMFTGFLYDSELETIVGNIKRNGKQGAREEFLTNLKSGESPLKEQYRDKLRGMDKAGIINSYWIKRYTSIFANILEFEAFLKAVERRQNEDKLGDVTIFASYEDAWKGLTSEQCRKKLEILQQAYPDKPEFKSDETVYPHRRAFNWLKAQNKYAFIDLQGDFGDFGDMNAKIKIINLPPIGRNFRILQGGSDIDVPSGAGTFMDAIAMVGQEVGPAFLLYPAVREQQETLENLLREAGADDSTLKDMQEYYKIQTTPLPNSEEEKNRVMGAASGMLYRAMFDEATRQKYRDDMSKVVFLIAKKSPSLINGLNAMTDLIDRIDKQQYTIGVDIGGTQMSVAVVDSNGKIIANETVGTVSKGTISQIESGI